MTNTSGKIRRLALRIPLRSTTEGAASRSLIPSSREVTGEDISFQFRVNLPTYFSDTASALCCHHAAISSRLCCLVSGTSFQPKKNRQTQTTANTQNTGPTDPKILSK